MLLSRSQDRDYQKLQRHESRGCDSPASLCRRPVAGTVGGASNNYRGQSISEDKAIQQRLCISLRETGNTAAEVVALKKGWGLTTPPRKAKGLAARPPLLTHRGSRELELTSQ